MKSIDADGSGVIDYTEFLASCNACGPPKLFYLFLLAFWTHLPGASMLCPGCHAGQKALHGGPMELQALVHDVCPLCRTRLQEDACWQAFRVFDRDGNGTISQKEPQT